MKRIVRIFSKPAPNLTHLELVAFASQGDSMPFPSFFGLEFPRLRVLKVVCVEDWPEIVGVNLTRITINFSLTPWILKRCIPYSPNLKVLKIQGVWRFDEPDLTGWQRITLPPGVRLVLQYVEVCPRILALFALPRDSQLKVIPSMGSDPDEQLLSYVLPTEISHLHNLHTLTRLHIKVHVDVGIFLELRCFRLDQLVFEVDVGCAFPTVAQGEALPVMRFLGSLHQIVLRGVEELRMEGPFGPVEPQEIEFPTLLKRMPALTRLITTGGNEETLRSALDSLGCRAVVIRVEG